MSDAFGPLVTPLQHVPFPRPPPHPTSPIPPPLAFPLPSEVENTRFRAFEKKRMTDGRTDGWTDPFIEMSGRI